MASKKILEMKSKCRFCRIGAGEVHFDYDRILMETEDHFAVTSVGGFIEGWTLLCTKRHVLNLSSDYRNAAFQKFAGQVANAVSDCYGNFVVFEHGVNRSESLTGCGTDHAHMHLVPFSGDFAKIAIEFDPERDWVIASSQDIERMASGQEYLMMANSLEDLSSSAYVSIVDQPKSQFFRKVLASHVGLAAQSDYRLYPFAERARHTSDRLAAMVLEQHSAVA